MNRIYLYAALSILFTIAQVVSTDLKHYDLGFIFTVLSALCLIPMARQLDKQR